MVTFNEIDDNEPALVHSPMVSAVEKIFAYVDEHGAIPLTSQKAFKRSFVTWAAKEFDWPRYSEAELGSASWVGADMQSRPQDWLLELSLRDVADLEQAARHYLSLDRNIGEITKASFPLGPFAQHLETLKHKLLNGIGFEVLRGLPVATYSQEMAAAVFCGVGAHLGSARSQNADGHILGHVRNVGADPNDPNVRIYQTSARQSFHTDSADVVGCCACGRR